MESEHFGDQWEFLTVYKNYQTKNFWEAKELPKLPFDIHKLDFNQFHSADLGNIKVLILSILLTREE